MNLLSRDSERPSRTGGETIVDFNRQPLDLGHVVASPSVVEVLSHANLTVRSLLIRHAAGDWGEVDDETCGENFRAIVTGRGVVSSAHRLDTGSVVLIVTELERRETSILLAEEI